MNMYYTIMRIVMVSVPTNEVFLCGKHAPICTYSKKIHINILFAALINSIFLVSKEWSLTLHSRLKIGKLSQHILSNSAHSHHWVFFFFIFFAFLVCSFLLYNIHRVCIPKVIFWNFLVRKKHLLTFKVVKLRSVIFFFL